MREKYTATIAGFTKKRFYTGEGYLYSTVQLQNLKVKNGEVVSEFTELKYTRSLHNLGLKPGMQLNFTAEIDKEAFEASRQIFLKRVIIQGMKECDQTNSI